MRNKDSTGYRGTLHDSPNLCGILLFLCAVNSTENKNTSSKSQRGVSLLKQILVSRNELREIENFGARDVEVLIANFLLQAREFLFLICVKKTISMRTLVLRVINSSRHRNCFVRGYIHSLFV